MRKLLVGILIIYILLLLQSYIYACEKVEQKNSIIRLHVIANSNDFYDQELKILIKNKILDDLIILRKVKSRKEAEKIIEQYILKLSKDWSENVLGYRIKARLEKSYFPTKIYGKEVYPAGEYQALKVIIGEGQGKNWWCVLYPPLCYLEHKEKEEIYDEDVLQVITPIKQDNKNIISIFKKVLLEVCL